MTRRTDHRPPDGAWEHRPAESGIWVQAVANGDTHIGSEHLLLGVLDAEGPGGAVLADLGADLGALRSSTLERLRRSA